MSIQPDGRSSRWDAHREERRADLIAAAVRAIDDQGPEVNMTDIAAEAGVSKPVLYRYFADKDELHAAVGQWGADEVLAGVVPALLVDAPVRARIEAAVDAYLRVIEEHPQVFFLLVRHRASGAGGAGDPLADGKARIAAMLTRFLAETMRGLGVDPGGAEPWSQGIVGLGLATGEWWLEKRTMPRAQISAYLSSFIWHSLEGPAGELGVPLSALDGS
ncbi:TetR family transcriptional regulator [Nocardioides psychrotolerans]|uniref:Transcriptional regulator, TetR family n=1 Tax=Nocardioides psychrotolerans TaxID=1005945 RepID=A0A1I3LYN9_9ACTN|nr:TetR family transcriptional regulator [Nocardioides psychrotolerans]GEP38964.1 TetR family transcriptional regulator [Nocardioides psychrotolerans]SFI89823.1 transcriptional regulator, TetR family [Nocardioides psychrotolerans]